MFLDLLTNNVVKTYDSVQWAAVTTYFLLIIIPPQRCLSKYWKETCQGTSVIRISSPPTIL